MRAKILITASIIIILSIAFIEILDFNKTLYGLRIANVNIGGKNKNEAEEIFSRQVEKINNEYFILKYGNRTEKIKPQNLGLNIEIQKTIDNAFKIGRDSNIFINLSTKLKILFFKRTISPTITINSQQLEIALEPFKKLENPYQNADIVYKNGEYLFIKSKPGRMFNRGLIIQNALANISKFKTSTIDLELKDAGAEITDDRVEPLADFLNRLSSGAPYYLVFGDKKIPLDKNLINQWITLQKEKINGLINITLKFDDDKIYDYLFSIMPAINGESRNAELKFENNKIGFKTPSQDKIELSIAETRENIKHNFLSTQQKTMEIYVKRQPAKINENNLNELGVKTLLSVGNSNFSGSPKTRIENIKIGAAKFQHYIIKPDEEFSLVKILGDIGPAQGYQPELVIKKGQTIKEYGGGLCQVSTTMFRAALKAGLQITERQPHAYPVKYYNPQGFDATIYPPHPDLRFINNTGNNILIQLTIEKYNIYFEFYGTNDGREVNIVGPTILESRADGSMKTNLIQQVFRDGKMVSEKTFFSAYRSPSLYPVIKNPLE